jgi:hypothetical protein
VAYHKCLNLLCTRELVIAVKSFKIQALGSILYKHYFLGNGTMAKYATVLVSCKILGYFNIYW